MSAIHEALKQAQDPKQKKDVPKTPPSGGGVAPVAMPKINTAGWLWGLTLALLLVQSELYFHESRLRRKAESKMQAAYLQLNDERGKSLDSVQERAKAEDRIESFKKERDRALAENRSLAKANKQVELDNLAKEKKISQLAKELHESEMSKLQLTEEIRSLKSQSKN